MNTFISLLRGINVSGQKKILMKDLKSLYESLGFENVITYIQSGNVVFKTELTNTEVLTELIYQKIKDHYGFEVPIEIRNQQQLQNIIDNVPFDKDILENETNRVMVIFLSDSPSKNNKEALLKLVSAPDQMHFLKTELYFYCPNGYGKTKLTNNFVEKKLNVIATTRNWKTTNKLLALARHLCQFTANS